METRFYFDTSIWLDFFEDRTEYGIEKGELVKKLLEKITKEESIIFYSDINIKELSGLGYGLYEVEESFKRIKPIMFYVESTTKQHNRARQILLKLKIPLLDVVHALIAKDNKAIMVTRDKDFQRLLDITMPYKPEELI